MIKAILHLFEVISGLKVNFHKNQQVGLKVDNEWVIRAASVLNCKVGSASFRYLGLLVGANAKRLSTWGPVVDKVKESLFGWRSKSLSFGDRIVLLKAVFTALRIYYLSFFKAPEGIISQLEYLFKQFLWGGEKETKWFNGLLGRIFVVSVNWVGYV